jgi:hypothetical protein
MSGYEHESASGFGDIEPAYEVCDVDEAHPQWSEVRPGVNYVASWRTARRAAARLRCALERTGAVGERPAFARVRGDGSAVVCLELEMPSAAALAVLLEEALRERAEGAPKIRGTPSPSRHVA